MQETRGFKPSTVSRRVSVVAGFYRTAVIDGLVARSPVEHVRRPRVPAESPTLGLSHLQFEAMLVAARQSTHASDFALVCFRGLLGLWIFEACGADIADLGEEHGHRVLRVVGKCSTGPDDGWTATPPGVGDDLPGAGGQLAQEIAGQFGRAAPDGFGQAESGVGLKVGAVGGPHERVGVSVVGHHRGATEEDIRAGQGVQDESLLERRGVEVDGVRRHRQGHRLTRGGRSGKRGAP
jgi:hypothetical protein